jgi:hypothetical protein
VRSVHAGRRSGGRQRQQGHRPAVTIPAYLPPFYRDLSLMLMAGSFVRTAELSCATGWVKTGLTWTYPGQGVPDLHRSSSKAGRLQAGERTPLVGALRLVITARPTALRWRFSAVAIDRSSAIPRTLPARAPHASSRPGTLPGTRPARPVVPVAPPGALWCPTGVLAVRWASHGTSMVELARRTSRHGQPRPSGPWRTGGATRPPRPFP